MESLVSHLIAFLSGSAIGAAGTYYGEKYTDIRKKKEARAELRATLKRLESLMPRLFAEIREDISGDMSGLVRELVVLPTPTTGFNGDKVRFAYYESRHDNLREQFHHLAQAGLVTDITPGNAPIYRMTEQFVELLGAR